MTDLITRARKEWCERREEETGNVTTPNVAIKRLP